MLLLDLAFSSYPQISVALSITIRILIRCYFFSGIARIGNNNEISARNFIKKNELLSIFSKIDYSRMNLTDDAFLEKLDNLLIQTQTIPTLRNVIIFSYRFHVDIIKRLKPHTRVHKFELISVIHCF